MTAIPQLKQYVGSIFFLHQGNFRLKKAWLHWYTSQRPRLLQRLFDERQTLERNIPRPVSSSNTRTFYIQWDTSLFPIASAGDKIHICHRLHLQLRCALYNYLRNISYEGELNVENKLNNLLKIAGILNNVFRPQNLLEKQE